MDKPSMSKCMNINQYTLKAIAYELEQTALGKAYYGNSLRVAKDIKGLSSNDISLLERFLTGREDKSGADFHALQALAVKINSFN